MAKINFTDEVKVFLYGIFLLILTGLGVKFVAGLFSIPTIVTTTLTVMAGLYVFKHFKISQFKQNYWVSYIIQQVILVLLIILLLGIAFLM